MPFRIGYHNGRTCLSDAIHILLYGVEPLYPLKTWEGFELALLWISLSSMFPRPPCTEFGCMSLIYDFSTYSRHWWNQPYRNGTLDLARIAHYYLCYGPKLWNGRRDLNPQVRCLTLSRVKVW